MGRASRRREVERLANLEGREPYEALIETFNARRAALLDHDPLIGNGEVLARAVICRRAVEQGWSLAEACEAMDVRTSEDLLSLLQATSISGAASMLEGLSGDSIERSTAAAADIMELMP